MLKRLRQLRISLATKCQILFGTAVAAIIFAALFVPWQRMEQLTEQLNEKAAGAVADTVVGDHINRQMALMRARSGRANPVEAEAEADETSAATTMPATAPLGTFIVDGQSFPSPHLVGISALKTAEKLTKFEQSALVRFVRDPRKRVERRYYDAGEGAEG